MEASYKITHFANEEPEISDLLRSLGAVVSELGLEPSSAPSLTCVSATRPYRFLFVYLAP